MGKEERERVEAGAQPRADPQGTELHSMGHEATRNMSEQENNKVRFIFSDNPM